MRYRLHDIPPSFSITRNYARRQNSARCKTRVLRTAQLAWSLRLATSHLLRLYAGVCIVGAARTPFGSFLGNLAHLNATQLGSAAIEGLAASQ